MPRTYTYPGTAALLALAACLGCAPPAQLVRVDGSPGVAPLVTALADAWRASGARDSIAMATGLGASARAAALADGTIDVAMASHGVDTADLRRRGIAVHEIARTPVVFAVNFGIPRTAITREQACEILAGRALSWSDVGGPDIAIVAATRPADEVDAEIMLAHVPCLRGLAPGPSVRVVARPDSMAALLASTAGAFGITSGTFVSASGGRIRALELDGVAPTASNVAAGSYPARSSFLLTRQDAPAAVQRFLAFVAGAEGRRVIQRAGGVPVR